MHIKGQGHYPLGKRINWSFNLDGRSNYYLIKGYWKRYFGKIMRQRYKSELKKVGVTDGHRL